MTKLFILLALAPISLIVGTSAGRSEPAQEETRPQWIVDAEDDFLGTWFNEKQDTRSIPRIDVLREAGELKVRF